MATDQTEMPIRTVFFPLLAKEVISRRLRQIDGVELIEIGDTREMATAIRDAEALIMPGGGTFYNAETARALKEQGNRLRWIQLTSAGFDGLEINGTPDGVIVTNNGGALGAPVAEHAMALLLALARRLPEFWDNQSRQTWNRHTRIPVISLEEKTVAVVGFGSIGREVARRASAFGMHVLGVRRTAEPDPLADQMFAMDDLGLALGQADAVVVSLPLNAATRQIINTETLAACKKGAWIVNVGRGGLVDSSAIIEALHSGHIGGAGLDVTDPEPLPPDHPLWTAPNIVISPHIAGSGSLASHGRVAEMIADNMRRFIAGEPLMNRQEIRHKPF